MPASLERSSPTHLSGIQTPPLPERDLTLKWRVVTYVAYLAALVAIICWAMAPAISML